MQSKEQNNLIIIRLFTDEDLFQSLKEVCQKYHVETAIVICGLGQLKNFTIGYFKEKGNYLPQDFENIHELLSLSGIISRKQGDYVLHLHAVLGNEAKETIGGHLLKGIVQTAGEITLLKSDMKVAREVEEKTGLQGLFPEG